MTLLFERRLIFAQILIHLLLPADSPGRTSCPDTGAPTPEWNRTSASSARRSSPAAITCRNTSKSTAFHEAAGQDALQTDPRAPALSWGAEPAGLFVFIVMHIHGTVIIYWLVRKSCKSNCYLTKHPHRWNKLLVYYNIYLSQIF